MNKEELLANIAAMKMVWIYVMLGSATGFVTMLLSSLDKFEADSCSISVIVRGTLSLIFFVTTLIAFGKARKLGKEEDKIKAFKDSDITSFMR